ncbi:MAG: hypothetical protein WA628_06500 [Terriglobales bacterium]
MSGWARFFVPSVCDLWFVLLMLVLTWGPLARGLLGDAGIGWHIRTGEMILNTHSIPRVDPFSSTMQGKSWYAWAWLYDAVAGAIHHAAGLNGVVFFSGLVIALTFALVLRKMLARGANPPVAMIMLLLAVSASTLHFFARPHVLSWLLTVVWFGILDTFEANGKTRPLLWLPVLTLLWVNLHGGFVVGFILLAIYFVDALANWLAARSEEDRGAALLRIQGLGLAGILSFVTTFANPYGYKLHIHIYQYLTDRFLMNHIDEFLSPNFHGLAQKCFAGILLLAVVAAGAARKKLSLGALLVVLFAIYAGLYAARNIPASSMLLALIVAPQVSGWLKEVAGSPEIAERIRRPMARLDNFGTRMATLGSGLRGHLWPALTVLLGLWICAHGGRLGATRVLDARFDDAHFPVQATDFLERSGRRDPVFCPDKWGGYLIYRLYPQTRVAVDDRHDLYGSEFLKRYLKIVHGEPGWQGALEGMGARWVLLPKDSAVVNLLTYSSQWKAVYRDETAVLFQRSDAAPTMAQP